MDIVTVSNITISNKDAKHSIKLVTVITILIELYRIFAGSMLLLSIQTMCGNNPCSPIEIILSSSGLFLAGISLNFVTLGAFAVLYMVEIRREARIVKYLEVNPQKPSDSDSVALELQKLKPSRMDALLHLNKLYGYAGYSILGLYLLNFILSATIIFMDYFDNRTPMTLVTNSLFIGGKLYNIFVIVNTDKNVFFSAYVSRHSQYNDVNKKKCLELRNVASI